MTAKANLNEISGSLSEQQMIWVNQIIKKDGSLYATKPKKADGQAKYIWRNVMFIVSTNRQHHCMPVCADFDIPSEAYIDYPCAKADEVMDAYPGAAKMYRKNKYEEEILKPVIDAIVDTIPKTQWYGIRRWGRALGY